MAQYIIKIVLTTLTIFAIANQTSAKVHSSHSVKISSTKEVAAKTPVNTEETATKHKTRSLSAHEEAPFEKKARPNSEELAHIHHFHKERVRKIKQHHEKYWAFSKFILVICHLALLVIAYLHIIH